MSGKQPFKFYLDDGTIAEASTDDDLKALGVYEQRKADLEAHYVSEMYNERRWRDQELALTDKFMLEDATYGGKSVRDSDIRQGILEYRQQLRDYDLKYQPRPIRPEWFK